MSFLISVGSVGRAQMNKYSTGAKGYQIVRRGKIVDCHWAGIYVLGPATYIWRRKPAHTRHRFKSEVSAKKFYSSKIARLQYSTYGYVSLGSRARIHLVPRASAVIREALRNLRQAGR